VANLTVASVPFVARTVDALVHQYAVRISGAISTSNHVRVGHACCAIATVTVIAGTRHHTRKELFASGQLVAPTIFFGANIINCAMGAIGAFEADFARAFRLAR
jgi:hypothetical protein